MNKFLMRLAINAIALYAAVKIVPGITAQNMNWLAFLGLALIFGLLNALLRPLLKLLTCPLIILTLGLFTLLINTFLFYLAGNLGTSKMNEKRSAVECASFYPDWLRNHQRLVKPA